MDESRRRGMAEVKGRQVEKVDDKKKFTRPEVASDPKQDEAEDKEVVLHVRQKLCQGQEVPKMQGR